MLVEKLPEYQTMSILNLFLNLCLLESVDVGLLDIPLNTVKLTAICSLLDGKSLSPLLHRLGFITSVASIDP